MEEMTNNLFIKSEDIIYKILDNLSNDQYVDKSLIYCFTKAFYLYISKLYLETKKSKINFDVLYSNYKQFLMDYYKTNNPTIAPDLLDQVLNFFDNSFSLIQTIEFSQIEDSYEFRHYTINVFDLLRMILSKKSKSIIRENIFDPYIRGIIEVADSIFIYWDKI